MRCAGISAQFSAVGTEIRRIADRCIEFTPADKLRIAYIVKILNSNALAHAVIFAGSFEPSALIGVNLDCCHAAKRPRMEEYRYDAAACAHINAAFVLLHPCKG